MMFLKNPTNHDTMKIAVDPETVQISVCNPELLFQDDNVLKEWVWDHCMVTEYDTQMIRQQKRRQKNCNSSLTTPMDWGSVSIFPKKMRMCNGSS